MTKWYEQEVKEKENIISTRIRLVRNWNEYVFPARLSERESVEMLGRLLGPGHQAGYCEACFGGVYAAGTPQITGKDRFERKRSEGKGEDD